MGMCLLSKMMIEKMKSTLVTVIRKLHDYQKFKINYKLI